MDLIYIDLAADTYSIDLSPGGGGGGEKPEVILERSILENGSYTFNPPPGSVFSSANINVSVPVPLDKNGYMYEMDFNDLDYEYAYEYFESKAPVFEPGMCSILKKGTIVGRNLDWLYNNDASFVVRTDGTLGIAGGLGYSISKLEEGLSDDEKKIIPFYLQDGMNKDGLFAGMNVMPYNNVPVAGSESGERVCAIMLVRYILDNYKSVGEVIEGIQTKQIYLPQALIADGYGIQFFVADSSMSEVITLVPNDGSDIGSISFTGNPDKLTNFNLYGVSVSPSGSVYTNYDVLSGNLPSSQGIEDYGTGLERWNTLNAAYSSIEDVDDMISAMKSVSFSNAYTKELGSNFWYSEFVGGDITVDTPPDNTNFIERIEYFKDEWERKSRDAEETLLWITTHTSVYDLENKTLKLFCQELEPKNELILFDGSKPEETFTVIPTNESQTITPTSGSVFSGGVVEGYDVDEIYDELIDINTGE